MQSLKKLNQEKDKKIQQIEEMIDKFESERLRFSEYQWKS